MTNKKTKKTNNKTRLNNFKKAINLLRLDLGAMFNQKINEKGELPIEAYKLFWKSQTLFNYMSEDTLRSDSDYERGMAVLELYKEGKHWLAEVPHNVPNDSVGYEVRKSASIIIDYLVWKYKITQREEGNKIITSMAI